MAAHAARAGLCRIRRARDLPSPVPEHPTITTGGERITLLPQRAVWWPRTRTLIVADLHLGKSQALRAAGAGIPGGDLDEALFRLECAAVDAAAVRIIVVGDLLHARAGLTEGLVERVARWRAGVRAEFIVTPGNHDGALASVAERWRIDIAPASIVEGGLRFVHEPDPQPGVFTWAGHIHPAVVLSAGGDRLKLPCFVVGERLGLLPAFTRFAAGGGLGVDPSRFPGRRYVIADEQVLDITPTAAPAAGG